MRITVALVQESRLTLRDILADIPRDLEAILVYLMFAAFIVFIWWGSRERPPGGGSDAPPPPDAGKRSPRLPERRQ